MTGFAAAAKRLQGRADLGFLACLGQLSNTQRGGLVSGGLILEIVKILPDGRAGPRLSLPAGKYAAISSAQLAIWRAFWAIPAISPAPIRLAMARIA